MFRKSISWIMWRPKFYLIVQYRVQTNKQTNKELLLCSFFCFLLSLRLPSDLALGSGAVSRQSVQRKHSVSGDVWTSAHVAFIKTTEKEKAMTFLYFNTVMSRFVEAFLFSFPNFRLSLNTRLIFVKYGMIRNLWSSETVPMLLFKLYSCFCPRISHTESGRRERKSVLEPPPSPGWRGLRLLSGLTGQTGPRWGSGPGAGPEGASWGRPPVGGTTRGWCKVTGCLECCPPRPQNRGMEEDGWWTCIFVSLEYEKIEAVVWIKMDF